LRWLTNFSGDIRSPGFLPFICQQGLGGFFRYQPLHLIGLRIVQIYANAGGNDSVNHSWCDQANQLLSMHNYTPLVISGNDKNKPTTLLSQRILALTGRNL
jgi:hypothetical protein